MAEQTPVIIEDKKGQESHKIDFSGIIPFLNSLDMIKVAEESESLGKNSSQFYFVGERFGIISFVSKKVGLYFTASYIVIILIFLLVKEKSVLFILGSALSIAYSIAAIALIERYKNSFGFLNKIVEDILLTSMTLIIATFIIADIVIYALIPEILSESVKACIHRATSQEGVIKCLKFGKQMKEILEIANEGFFKNFTALSLTKLPAIMLPYIYFKLHVKDLSKFKTKVELYFNEFRRKA